MCILDGPNRNYGSINSTRGSSKICKSFMTIDIARPCITKTFPTFCGADLRNHCSDGAPQKSIYY
jgi:hypothetical protein